jgi:hypothetical protein
MKELSTPFEEQDLVWAKVQNYPWWPAKVHIFSLRLSKSSNKKIPSFSKSASTPIPHSNYSFYSAAILRRMLLLPLMTLRMRLMTALLLVTNFRGRLFWQITLFKENDSLFDRGKTVPLISNPSPNNRSPKSLKNTPKKRLNSSRRPFPLISRPKIPIEKPANSKRQLKFKIFSPNTNFTKYPFLPNRLKSILPNTLNQRKWPVKLKAMKRTKLSFSI